MAKKRPNGLNVFEAARARIARVFDDFPRICVSFSAGKDSTVMLHLAALEARTRGRKIGVLLVDLEAQYALTMEHARAMLDLYADVLEPHWVCLPIALRNAVSNIEPRWTCWDTDARDAWVRQPPKGAITDPAHFPFFRVGMEFEEFVPVFNAWYAQGKLCAVLVGIRTQESLNRWRAITGNNARYEDLPWTTIKGPRVVNAYPIYDWRTEDIWTYHARTGLPYNALYDRFHQAGLTIHQMRMSGTTSVVLED